MHIFNYTALSRYTQNTRSGAPSCQLHLAAAVPQVRQAYDLQSAYRNVTRWQHTHEHTCGIQPCLVPIASLRPSQY
jgi:hypothetical protein